MLKRTRTDADLCTLKLGSVLVFFTSTDAKMHTENLRYINHTKNNSSVVSLDT